MKHSTIAVFVVLGMVACIGLNVVFQLQWEQGCQWCTARDTQVYTPGTADVAATLPAGTSIRAEETVGEGWLEIEYMVDGKCYTGMVRAGTVRAR